MGRKPTCLCAKCKVKKCPKEEVIEVDASGPMNIVLIDQTRIGLKFDVFRAGRAINVVAFMPDKEMPVQHYNIKSIRVRREKLTVIGWE